MTIGESIGNLQKKTLQELFKKRFQERNIEVFSYGNIKTTFAMLYGICQEELQNVEKYIAKCISSVINQTYQNLEIILIDDGSTDYSGRLCNEFARVDKRIKVVHQTNKGVINARNNTLYFLYRSFF